MVNACFVEPDSGVATGGVGVLEVVMTSRPVDQEGHCFLVVCSSPRPRKEFDWNGDVATRVDMRTTSG